MRPVSTNSVRNKDASQLTLNDLRVGDEILLTTIEGAKHELVVVEVDDRKLQGIVCDDCNTVSISVTSIDSLQVKRTNALKSVGASAGVLVGIILLLVLISGPPFPPGL